MMARSPMPERKSLYRMAVLEAAAFRADRAAREGQDPGREAIRQWNRERWWVWCGERLREHLRGEAFFEEFGEAFFDILDRPGFALGEEVRAAIDRPAQNGGGSIHERLDDLLKRIEETLASAGIGASCRSCGRTFLRPKPRPEAIEGPGPESAEGLCPSCRAAKPLDA